jgi:hypothetical protein
MEIQNFFSHIFNVADGFVCGGQHANVATPSEQFAEKNPHIQSVPGKSAKPVEGIHCIQDNEPIMVANHLNEIAVCVASVKFLAGTVSSAQIAQIVWLIIFKNFVQPTKVNAVKRATFKNKM